MTTRNDITGDNIKTGSNSKKYKEGWDRIFKEKEKKDEKEKSK